MALMPLPLIALLLIFTVPVSPELRAEDWSSKLSAMLAVPNGPHVDLKNGIVALPVEVSNLEGGLEFLASHGKAKDYESIFTSTVKGSMLHFALTSAGFEPSSFDPEEKDFATRINQLKEKGTRLQLRYLPEGGDTPVPVENMLKWSDESDVEAGTWFFAGSYHEQREDKNFYAADLSLCLVGTYPTLNMPVGSLHPVGNPYGDKERYWMPNRKNLPTLGSRGWLIFTRLPTPAP